MYDTHLFPKEPSGVEGGKSIIDMGNMPVILTPNEYRDGIIRSMLLEVYIWELVLQQKKHLYITLEIHY